MVNPARQGQQPFIGAELPDPVVTTGYNTPKLDVSELEAAQIIEQKALRYAAELREAVNEVVDGKRGNPRKTFEILAELTKEENRHYLSHLRSSNKLQNVIADMENNHYQWDEQGSVPTAFTRLDRLRVGAILAHGNQQKTVMIKNLLNVELNNFDDELEKRHIIQLANALIHPENFGEISRIYKEKFDADLMEEIRDFSDKLYGMIVSKNERYVDELARASGLTREEFLRRKTAELTRMPGEDASESEAPSASREELQAELARLEAEVGPGLVPPGAAARRKVSRQQFTPSVQVSRGPLPWVHSQEVQEWLKHHPSHIRYFRSGELSPDGHPLHIGEGTFSKDTARKAQNWHLRKLLDSGIINLSSAERAAMIPEGRSPDELMDNPFVPQTQIDQWARERAERLK